MAVVHDKLHIHFAQVFGHEEKARFRRMAAGVHLQRAEEDRCGLFGKPLNGNGIARRSGPHHPASRGAKTLRTASAE
ncbi:hypothetical protein, partial [Calditerricola satsumensis]|uniref:hypothetical protein n=1 Tax=Calditerricola satsumensis TaxID=373054 RepID=UPI00210CA902